MTTVRGANPGLALVTLVPCEALGRRELDLAALVAEEERDELPELALLALVALVYCAEQGRLKVEIGTP